MGKGITAIVLNDGNISETRRCLASIKEQSCHVEKILAVNNCRTGCFSGNGSVQLNVGKNIGAAAARNLAAKNSDSKFLLFVDNDAFLEKDCIKNLANTMETGKNIGAVSSVILEKGSKKVWFSGGTIDSLSLETKHSADGITEDTATQYAPTTALLVKKSVFESIGGFDEKFFVYFEDTDFCFRLGERFKILVSSKAIAWHNFSEAPKKARRRAFFFSRNKILFAKKHLAFPRLLAFLLYFCTIGTAKNLLSFVVQKRAILFFFHLGGILAGIFA